MSGGLRARVPEGLKLPVRVARVERARRALRRRAEAADGIAGLVALASEFACGPVTISPYQVRSEITGLLERLAERQPGTVLEIGTAKGGTLFLLARVAARDAVLVSVDLPGGRFGGGYDATRAPLYRSFARGGQRIELVRGDSHDPATRAEVGRLLAGRALDFLLVDGDHTPEGVRADYELYADLVRPGGLIAFHDIVPGEPHVAGGVPAFWRELRAAAAGRTDEIVESWEQGGGGIGILEVAEP